MESFVNRTIRINATALLPRISVYEQPIGSSGTFGGDEVTLQFLNGDPMLAVLLVGVGILYYWHLYGLMRRSKRRTGSYWRD